MNKQNSNVPKSDKSIAVYNTFFYVAIISNYGAGLGEGIS